MSKRKHSRFASIAARARPASFLTQSITSASAGVVWREPRMQAKLYPLRTHWAASNWRITRDRDLENGGVNIAAIEPITGNTYSLDSGFDAGPTRYIVGYFGTPCLT